MNSKIIVTFINGAEAAIPVEIKNVAMASEAITEFALHCTQIPFFVTPEGAFYTSHIHRIQLKIDKPKEIDPKSQNSAKILAFSHPQSRLNFEERISEQLSLKLD